jgi:transcriptional regulator with XRE-family HTH domain
MTRLSSHRVKNFRSGCDPDGSPCLVLPKSGNMRPAVLNAGDTVAARLRRAIDENGLSVRELSRRLAGIKQGWSAEADSQHRQIYKWLAGTWPEPAQAAKLAKILKRPAAEFRPTRVEELRREEQTAELRLERIRQELREARELAERALAARERRPSATNSR